MGTDCAPFLANLYLYALEFQYLEKLTKEKELREARKFSKCFRYIDDLLCFNNDNLVMEKVLEIYPPELVLKKTNLNDQSCTFLDIGAKIVDHSIHTTLYDKRDDFNFAINSFPILTGNIHKRRSHGVLVSQLIRYSKVCMNAVDFCEKSKSLHYASKSTF
jgi:hypothetical protein